MYKKFGRIFKWLFMKPFKTALFWSTKPLQQRISLCLLQFFCHCFVDRSYVHIVDCCDIHLNKFLPILMSCFILSKYPLCHYAINIFPKYSVPWWFFTYIFNIPKTREKNSHSHCMLQKPEREVSAKGPLGSNLTWFI